MPMTLCVTNVVEDTIYVTKNARRAFFVVWVRLSNIENNLLRTVLTVYSD